jgi:hypothetical protein
MLCTVNSASHTGTSPSPPTSQRASSCASTTRTSVMRLSGRLQCRFGADAYLIQRCQLEAYTRPINWYYLVKICIERPPLHAWNEEGVKQQLGDMCVFDHMESESFTQESTEVFSFYAWMFNLDFLPRSKIVTFFHEKAGRSDINDGPPPVTASLSQPPGGQELMILIYLDHYLNWMPKSERSASSSVSGMPCSSDSSVEGLFSVFRSSMASRRCAQPGRALL